MTSTNNNFATIPAPVANFFAADDLHGEVYFCRACNHVGTRGQFDLYSGHCAGCGVVGPVKFERPGLPHYATAADAARAMREQRGDAFATAAELEMLLAEPECLRDVLQGWHRVSFVVDEYAAETAAADAAAAAAIADANDRRVRPAGFLEVGGGHVQAGDWVWNNHTGEFDIFNVDVPEMMVCYCVLVCREVKF